MANSWLRLWHDMPNDPKWRTISRVSGEPIALVQAIYLQLLVSASQNVTRDENGVTLHSVTVTNEDIASALDVTERNVESVISAMQGRVLDGNRVKGWDKRQATSANARNGGKPAKSGAERAREYRERKKQREMGSQSVTSRNVTSCDSNSVTPQIREDKKRRDINNKPPVVPHGDVTQGSDCDAVTPTFEAFWEIYPQRAGSNSKTKALKAWDNRLSENIPPDKMIAGAARYAAYIAATRKTGTEFVMQASRFLGSGHHFEENYLIPGNGSCEIYTGTNYPTPEGWRSE
ncbi:phage replisome organizer [Pantoea osteomyelitidis]|uniref:Phage replisome organizer n=1 Tax=Pantoea osteomyelitidis TaxID=3230026 RepID=A0ABW7PV60_9GAMM